MSSDTIICSGKAVSKTTLAMVSCRVQKFSPVSGKAEGEEQFPDGLFTRVSQDKNFHNTSKSSGRGIWHTTNFKIPAGTHHLAKIVYKVQRQGVIHAHSALLLYLTDKAPRIQVLVEFPENEQVMHGTVSTFYGNAFIVTPSQANELCDNFVPQSYVARYCDTQEVKEDFSVKSLCGRMIHLDGSRTAREAALDVLKPKRRIRI